MSLSEMMLSVLHPDTVPLQDECVVVRKKRNLHLEFNQGHFTDGMRSPWKLLVDASRCRVDSRLVSFVSVFAFSPYCVCQLIENRARMRGSRTVESLTLCSRSVKEEPYHLRILIVHLQRRSQTAGAVRVCARSQTVVSVHLSHRSTRAPESDNYSQPSNGPFLTLLPPPSSSLTETPKSNFHRRKSSFLQ